MRQILSILAALTLTANLAAQSPPPQRPDTQILHASTQLVIVDVVVQDHDGHPVHGLRREDFTLTENKQPQEISHFEEHSNITPAKSGPAFNLPPGTFTNYTPTPPNGALNILLLDALNTPMKDQSYVRYQLQQYVKKADPGTRIAIFGLNTRLTILQGFSSDPQILKDAVGHKLIPRASNLLDDPVSGNSDDFSSLGEVSANMAQFEAQTASFQMQLRMQYTLDAFNVLARYLSGFPGRKNLIWFSGSFPLDILPDPTLADPFAVMAGSEEEFRETTNLLTRAQIAVYPIDARGLMVNPVFDASRSGRGMTTQSFAKSISGFGQSQAQEHMTMEAMANDTGGHAFYNTNGLADAVAKAIEAGSNYYTLTYAPSNHKATGEYRNIKVILTNDATAHALKLSYRQGYYAEDPAHPLNKADAASLSETAAVQSHSATAYAQASMARGAPTPEDILFKVRVLPGSTAAEPEVAANNQLDPAKPLKGPFRRFDIDYAALAAAFTLVPQPDGTHKGAIEFTALLYDPDGKLLNAAGKTVQLNLTPETYKQFLQAARQGTGIAAHLEISAPLKQETYLRIGIHDIPSNQFGAVEVPIASVSHLPPAPPNPTPPSSTPATPPTPSTATH